MSSWTAAKTAGKYDVHSWTRSQLWQVTFYSPCHAPTTLLAMAVPATKAWPMHSHWWATLLCLLLLPDSQPSKVSTCSYVTILHPAHKISCNQCSAACLLQLRPAPDNCCCYWFVNVAWHCRDHCCRPGAPSPAKMSPSHRAPSVHLNTASPTLAHHPAAWIHSTGSHCNQACTTMI